MVNEYNDTFNKLVVAWKKKLQDGLYIGLSDDVELNEVIKPLQFKLSELNYRSTLLSIVSDISRTVRDIEGNLDRGTNYSKVYI